MLLQKLQPNSLISHQDSNRVSATRAKHVKAVKIRLFLNNKTGLTFANDCSKVIYNLQNYTEF